MVLDVLPENESLDRLPLTYLQRPTLSLPEIVENAVRDALATLGAAVTCTPQAYGTHQVIHVQGWNDSIAVRRAIGRYLVGLRACTIDAALNIRRTLLPTADDQLDLASSVYQIIGETPKSLSATQRRNERNPWIAEGLWHLCLNLARTRTELHPAGDVIGIAYVNIRAKDHGTDVVAMYKRSAGLGLSIVESKAYKLTPLRAVRNSVAFFRAVDRDVYGVDVRQAVEVIRAALPQDLQELVSPSFWKRERTYIPNPHYDDSVVVDWTIRRSSWAPLGVPPRTLVVMPHSVTSFNRFFARVAGHMRAFITTL